MTSKIKSLLRKNQGYLVFLALFGGLGLLVGGNPTLGIAAGCFLMAAICGVALIVILVRGPISLSKPQA